MNWAEIFLKYIWVPIMAPLIVLLAIYLFKNKRINFRQHLKKKIHRIILVSFILILLLLSVFLILTKINKKHDNEYFSVLILPFELRQGNTEKVYNIEHELIEKLENEIENENIKIKVEFNDKIKDYTTSRTKKTIDQIAKKQNVDLVIWGNLYEIPSDTLEVVLNYSYFGNESIPFEAKNKQKYSTTSLRTISEETFAFESEFIIDWIIYLQLKKQANYYITDFFDKNDLFIKKGETGRTFSNHEKEKLDSVLYNHSEPTLYKGLNHLSKIKPHTLINKKLYYEEYIYIY